ncbi:MAG: Na(+)/H(+) antiporter subunit D [Gammaproteobacteria bacterium]|jgi:multicomponent Na+:H+ antiporter subunit D
MTSSLFHPGLLLILAGFIIPLLQGTKRTVFILAVPCLALASVWSMEFGNHGSFQYLGFELNLINLDTVSRLFITVFAITVFTGSLFCCKQAKSKELAAAFIYAGGAMSVVLAGDLISLFVFWELMALASTMVIWSAQTEGSWRAGMRYVVVHFLGGVILMAGITAHVHETGSIVFTAMQADSVATWLILCGFLLNAGAPPLTAWLADAYPEASFSGTVFLSAFTTKTAVYVLLRGFPGTEILVFIGVFMIFYGIIYALLENDMRRILAYSIINQVGFMITGIGIGTEMALNGAAAHAFTHIIYKALLLMSAGSVLYMTGKRKCTDLGGLIHSMPVTAICGIIGALAISSFPFTSGFVSKSMVTQSSIDQHILWVWLLLQAASAGVFLHAGIKFPWFVFFQKDSGLRPEEPPLNMRIAMIFFAFACVFLGVFPDVLYSMLPYEVNYVPYTAAHILTQLQLLLFSGLAFFVMLPLMKRTLTISLDFDWFYRKFGKVVSAIILRNLCLLQGWLGQTISNIKLIALLDSQLNSRISLAAGMSLILLVFLFSLAYFMV